MSVCSAALNILSWNILRKQISVGKITAQAAELGLPYGALIAHMIDLI
jgi:hypothetical protein